MYGRAAALEEQREALGMSMMLGRKPSPARVLALRILSRAEAGERPVEELMAEVLRRHGSLPRRDRALVLELVQGVKRWEIRLDYVLSRLSHLPWARVHPLVRQILRLAAYQILFLTRIPAHAAVDEAVRLAQARGLPEAHRGFINAVLRRLAAAGEPPLPGDDPVLALSVAQAHPEWLVRRWLARHGLRETEERLAADNHIPPLTVRVNTWRIDPPTLIRQLAREGVKAEPGRYSPVSLIFTEVSEPPLELPSYRQGLWLFQDEAAQLVSFLLPVTPGAKVVEIGAGRGGKTSHLGERLHNQGLVLAVDLHPRRLHELRELGRRWGLTCIQALRADATRPLPLRPASLDGALLDAPCSSLGILRRHPEIKTRLKESDLATFPPRQREMLARTAPLLKPGAYLVYVTCTTEPEENEALISAFLGEHPEFAPVYEPESLPPPARPLLQPPGFFRTSPAEHGLDGFFAAVLKKGG